MTSYVAVAPVVLVARTSGAVSTITRGDPVPPDATSQAITHLLSLNYIAEGGSAPPVSSNAVPLPSTGDAGKVLTVSQAEDGYELDVASGGASVPAGAFFILSLTTRSDGNENTVANCAAQNWEAGYQAPNDYWGSDVSGDLTALALTYDGSGNPILPRGTYEIQAALSATLAAPLSAPKYGTVTVGGSNSSSLQGWITAHDSVVQGGASGAITVLPTGYGFNLSFALDDSAHDTDVTGLQLYVTIIQLAANPLA